MKVKVVCRKLYDYVQYDLKEIAFPSSLPDPPHIKKRRKLTWHERLVRLFSNFSSTVRVLRPLGFMLQVG
ncbi:hypothetical protein Gotur_002529 [Gossypium turneri]